MDDFRIGDHVIVSQQLVNNAPDSLLTDGSVQSIVGMAGVVSFKVMDYILVTMSTGDVWPFYPDELIKE
jgi:hypothetical protein